MLFPNCTASRSCAWAADAVNEHSKKTSAKNRTFIEIPIGLNTPILRNSGLIGTFA
jgi:hypothetical protein